MIPTTPVQTQIGYCTNVHAGRDLASVLENLSNYCLPIRQLVAPEASLGVGLWFSEDSARQTLQSDNLSLLRGKLSECGLLPFSLNGFPQGDFHSQIVKHRVYLPTWWQAKRRDYTLNLIKILDAILPSGQIGSISTLPISWGSPKPSDEQLRVAATHLLQVAMVLHELFETTGRFITIAIEPEPGCYLTDTASLRRFFRDYLSEPSLSATESSIAHRYLSICHDVCHAAVMFEDQKFEMAQLRSDGIAIGKVQVSSAVDVPWSSMTEDGRIRAFEQLSAFAEYRYLHQTNCKLSDDTIQSFEDLPAALRIVNSPAQLVGTWRVHFHVPIYLNALGDLNSTQPEILKTLDILHGPEECRPRFSGHYELETYAWEVLPQAIRVVNLCQGIASEIQWFEKNLNSTLSSH